MHQLPISSLNQNMSNSFVSNSPRIHFILPYLTGEKTYNIFTSEFGHTACENVNR